MTARMRSQNTMLRGTLDLLAAARAQLAAHAGPSPGQAQAPADAGLSANARDAELASLREDVELKREQLETLRQQLEIAQSQAQDCRALLQRLEAEQAARQHLKVLLQQATQQQQIDSGSSLQQTEAKGPLDGIEGGRIQFEAELAELRSQHAHVCAELDRQHATSQGVADDLQRAQQAVSALTSQVEELQATVAVSAESRADLVDQQQQLAAQVEELQDALAASAESRAALEEQQQRLTAQLENEQAASQHLADALLQRQQQVKALEAQLGDLEAALAVSTEDKAGLSGELQQLQATLAASSESRADLCDELRQLQATLAASTEDRSHLGDELQQLKNALAASSQSRADLSDQLLRLQAAHDEAGRELQHWRASAERLAGDLLDSQAGPQRATGGAQEPTALDPVSEDSEAAELAARRGHQQMGAFNGYGSELQGGPRAPLQCHHDLVSELERMRAKHAEAMHELHFRRHSAESLAKERHSSRPRLGAPPQQQNAPLALAAAPADSSIGDLLQPSASEHGQIHVQLDVIREPQVAREERVSICILVSEAATALCPSLQQVSP